MSLFGHLLEPIRQIGLLTGRLLKTGQTTQYSGELDDGYYERGLTKRYRIRTAGQYAGTTAIVVGGNTDTKSNNVVQDLVTGLMWSRYLSAGVGPGTDGNMVWTGAADDIFDYCAQANAVGLAGHSDWRVANLFELMSLCNFQPPTAVPDAVAFPGWTTDPVWTATVTPNNVNQRKYLRFSNGASGDALTTTAYYCALVRSG